MMKKRMFAAIAAAAVTALSCTFSASAIAVSPEPADNWAGYQKLDSDIYMDENGRTYLITPKEKCYQFVLKPDVDADSAKAVIIDILDSCYSTDEDFAVSRVTGNTIYTIYDNTEQSSENAEIVMQELMKQGLISEFYTCGQLAARVSCWLDHPLSYWSMEPLDTEPLLQYLETNGIAGTVKLAENIIGNLYRHRYYLVLDEPLSQAEYFLLAADIREKTGLGAIRCADMEIESEILGQNALERPGDLNIDGASDVSDAVLLARTVAEDDNIPAICDTGYLNADVDGDGLLTIMDVTALLDHIANIPAES